MPERLDEMARISFGDLPPVDVPALAQRARRRRRSRRGALVGGVGLIVVALATALVVPRRSDESQQVVTRPDVAGDLLLGGEPIGAWRQAADPPYSPRGHVFADGLDDGRVLVWGGIDAADLGQGGAGGIPYFLPDGGIFDPGTDTWEAIPPVPLPDGHRIIGPSGVMFYTAHVEGDTLAIVGRVDDDVIDAAVYDITDRRWSVAPPQDDLNGAGVDTAWDGETLVLVRTGSGYNREPFDVPGPFTRRWSPGDTAWSDGAPPPLAGRSFATTAYDDGRLALFGGTTTRNPFGAGLDTEPDPGARRDGAIYDLADDEWTPIPAAPPGIEAGSGRALTWRDGDLLVGGAAGDPVGTSRFSALAAYRPGANRAWRSLPSSPPITVDGGEVPSTPWVVGGGLPQGDPPVVVADDLDGFLGPHPWFLFDLDWEQAPYPSLVDGDDVDVSVSNQSTSQTTDDEEPALVAVRQGPGTWRPGTAAPFPGGWDTAVVTTDGLLVALSAKNWASLDDGYRAWVFDPQG